MGNVYPIEVSGQQASGQPEILDGASDLFVDVLGELGQHARAAFSVEQLPLNAPVELAVTFALSPGRRVRPRTEV